MTYITTNSLPTATRGAKGRFHSVRDALWASPLGPGLKVCTPFSLDKAIPNISTEADIETHDAQLQPVPVVTLNGSHIRMIDLAPGYVSPMHRTLSFDYAVCVEDASTDGTGMVELDVDGETKMLKRGDIIILRGTMHSWKNRSATKWARLVGIVIDIENLVIGGKILEEKWIW